MDLGKFYSGQEVLITGGLGFIGSNLAIRLVGLGAKVTVLDSLDKHCGGNIFNIEPVKSKVTIISEDARNQDAMINAVKGKRIVFSLAGHLSHKRSMELPQLDFSLNVETGISLLEACRKNGGQVKIVYTGTRGQYGKVLYNPVDENHPKNFTDVNGISKQAGEDMHLLYGKLYPNIKVACARLTNCYGPRHQMLDPSQGFIGWFIRKAMDNETLEIWGGEQTRDCNFVDDVVEALLLMGASEKADGEVFNLGSGADICLKDIARIIVETCGSGSLKIIPFPETHKKIEIGEYKADIRKITNILGWKPNTGLEEGLKKTIEFYKACKAQYW